MVDDLLDQGVGIGFLDVFACFGLELTPPSAPTRQSFPCPLPIPSRMIHSLTSLTAGLSVNCFLTDNRLIPYPCTIETD